MRGRGRGMRGSRGGAGVGPGVGGPRRNPYMDPYMPYYYPPYGYDGALYFRCVTHDNSSQHIFPSILSTEYVLFSVVFLN
jgi:hypothetical protein